MLAGFKTFSVWIGYDCCVILLNINFLVCPGVPVDSVFCEQSKMLLTVVLFVVIASSYSKFY